MNSHSHLHPAATTAPRPSRIINIEHLLRQLKASDRDARLNEQWDELIELTLEAWTWRDPESLAALKGRIGRLQASVLEDWRE